jgi:hypothetical protein
MEMEVINGVKAYKNYELGDIAPLYVQYDGQYNPQPSYFEIDPEDRSVQFGYNCEIGNAIPMNLWNNRLLWLDCDNRLPVDALEEFVNDDKNINLIQLIFEGYECVWDGRNHVGKYTNTAKQAENDLLKNLEDLVEIYEDRLQCCGSVCDYLTDRFFKNNTWYLSGQTDGWKIMENTSDEELSELAMEIEDCAKDEGILLNDAINQLIEWRDELKDEL